jgi:hypothetical protein
MLSPKHQRCGNCRFFCQDPDPENRLYFDEKSGECRRSPPHTNFTWCRTRLQHWCGEWQPQTDKMQDWQRISAHPRDGRPAILYRRGGFCRQSGMIIGYWNAPFNKWHDDGDRLFEYNEFTAWMDLPDPPEK